jgi:hypothetical protein
MSAASSRPPAARTAWLLGLAGLIPFAAASATRAAGPPELAGPALLALLAYAAVILSFLGGVRWGAELSAERPSPAVIALSVLPSLAAWTLLVAPAPWSPTHRIRPRLRRSMAVGPPLAPPPALVPQPPPPPDRRRTRLAPPGSAVDQNLRGGLVIPDEHRDSDRDRGRSTRSERADSAPAERAKAASGDRSAWSVAWVSLRRPGAPFGDARSPQALIVAENPRLGAASRATLLSGL